MIDGHAQLLQLKGAGIADNVSIHDGLGVIAGEAEVGIDGWRQVIDDVAGRYRDFKAVGIARWFLEFDGELPGFFSLQESLTFVPDHARPHQQKIAGVLGVVRRLERVVEAERLIGLLKIDKAGVGDVKTGKRTCRELPRSA